YHWRLLGYQSAEHFFESMHISEGEQLSAFVRFIKADANLHQAIKNRDWETFARLYNGPAYARNRYDLQLADADDRHRQIGSVPSAIPLSSHAQSTGGSVVGQWLTSVWEQFVFAFLQGGLA